MKKLSLFFALVGFCVLGYSQDVKVNINNKDATVTDECAYRINGICSSEDIGGVDVEIVFADKITWAVFTNYNDYPVTVLYEISKKKRGIYSDCYNCSGEYNYSTPDGSIGSMVLGKESSKKIKLDHSEYSSRTFDNSDCYSIKGIIVRKLSK